MLYFIWWNKTSSTHQPNNFVQKDPFSCVKRPLKVIGMREYFLDLTAHNVESFKSSALLMHHEVQLTDLELRLKLTKCPHIMAHNGKIQYNLWQHKIANN